MAVLMSFQKSARSFWQQTTTIKEISECVYSKGNDDFQDFLFVISKVLFKKEQKIIENDCLPVVCLKESWKNKVCYSSKYLMRDPWK